MSDALGHVNVVDTAIADNDTTESAIPHVQSTHTKFKTDVNIEESSTYIQNQAIEGILNGYKDVLSDLPRSPKPIEHHMETITNDPVKAKGRAMPLHMDKIIREGVDKMLLLGLIEPSKSAYSAPVMITVKKGYAKRVCGDYRQLNRKTYAEPMSSADQLFSKLEKHTYFIIDWAKGYWEVPINEGSKGKTGSITPVCLSQFTVMLIGFVNSPATFCRLVRNLLYGMDNIENL